MTASPLAALAAALVPARAEAALARHPEPGHAAQAARLARLGREERLSALAAALAAGAPPPHGGEAIAEGERPRVAAQLRAPGGPEHPVLRRLAAERAWAGQSGRSG